MIAFDAFFEKAPMPLALVNPCGEILLGNRSLLRLLGFRPEELKGQSLSRLICAPQDAPSIRNILRSSDAEGRQQECEVRSKSGRSLPVRLSFVHMGEEGSPLVLALEDLSERQRTQESLHALTYLDAMTGLPNRALLLDRLTQAIFKAQRDRRRIALVLINLARFRKLNDSFGHEGGNRLLREVGERIAANVRRADSVARYQGDKFAVLLEGLQNEQPVSGIVSTILKALGRPFHIDSQEVFLTFTAGVALFAEDGDNPEDILRNAETAMYQARERGENSYQFYAEGMNARMRERLKLESALHRGLERDEFELFYQPQIDPCGGTLCGVEALLRWRRSPGHYLCPGEFIPLLEETGLIHDVGRWALRQACRQAKQWQQEGFPHLCMAANVSARQLQEGDFVEMVEGALAEAGLDPSSLVLEITESVLVQHQPQSVETLAALAGRGVRIAIDDFGTGYSSLSYLKWFPVHILKIDRNFVAGMPSNREDRAIGIAILSLAESLGLHVTAEGIETWEQLEMLQAWRCNQVQGYLFARPMPASQLPLWASRDLPALRPLFLRCDELPE